MKQRLDYYQILSVSRESTDRELKIAYRKLALKLHPDKNIENSKRAAENFKELSQAYSTLADPEKRMIYDIFGIQEEMAIELDCTDINPGQLLNKNDVNCDSKSRTRNRSRSCRLMKEFEAAFEDCFNKVQKKNKKKIKLLSS